MYMCTPCVVISLAHISMHALWGHIPARIPIAFFFCAQTLQEYHPRVHFDACVVGPIFLRAHHGTLFCACKLRGHVPRTHFEVITLVPFIARIWVHSSLPSWGCVVITPVPMHTPICTCINIIFMHTCILHPHTCSYFQGILYAPCVHQMS